MLRGGATARDEPTGRGALTILSEDRSVTWSEGSWREPAWYASPRGQLMLLVLHPPQHCERGIAEVHVLQRSSGKTAVVGFDLDPSAAGPGCFQE